MDANPISAGKILSPLDARTPEQVAARFGELRKQFPDQYAAYSERVKRIIPFIL